MDKTFTLVLSEAEINFVWGVINNCQIKGSDAPAVVSLMQKVQQAVQMQAQVPDNVEVVEE